MPITTQLVNSLKLTTNNFQLNKFQNLEKVTLTLTITFHSSVIIQYEWGTGIRGLMRGMATLLQGNQELLVVRDKVGRPQVSLG